MIDIESIVKRNIDKKYFVTYNKAPYYGLLELLKLVIEHTTNSIVVCLIPTVDDEYNSSIINECLQSDRFRLYEVSFATRVLLESRARIYCRRDPNNSIIVDPTDWMKYKEEYITEQKPHDFF